MTASFGQAAARGCLIGVVLAGLWWAWPTDPRWLPGPIAPDPPEQGPRVDEALAPTWSLAGFTVRGVAPYRLTARVLGVRDYRGRDDLGDVMTLDAALGWGGMSDQQVLDGLYIHQGDRWYVYEWDGPPPFPVGDMAKSSANVHLVPESPHVADQIHRLRLGDRVHLDGWLVNLEGEGGRVVRSSTSRKDTGAGACEVMLVRQVWREPAPL